MRKKALYGDDSVKEKSLASDSSLGLFLEIGVEPLIHIGASSNVDLLATYFFYSDAVGLVLLWLRANPKGPFNMIRIQ